MRDLDIHTLICFLVNFEIMSKSWDLRNYVKSGLMFVVVVIFFLYETFSLYLICISAQEGKDEA